jgi:hypothetical protein
VNLDEPDYMDIDESHEGFDCQHCGKEAIVVQRDFGIGAYEYWGSKGVHREMRNCCSECGEEI